LKKNIKETKVHIIPVALKTEDVELPKNRKAIIGARPEFIT